MTREQIEQRIAELTAAIDRTSAGGHEARHAGFVRLAEPYYGQANDGIAERSVLRERLAMPDD
jgi:hypothetical protein